MPQPAQVGRLSAELRSAYQAAQAEIQAELEAISALPETEQARKGRRVARLRELEASVSERMDILDEFSRVWLSENVPIIYRAGAEEAAGILGEPFRWTQGDLAAISELAGTTWDDLLAASANMRDSTKRLIRQLARERALVGRVAGETATQSARRLRNLLQRRGVWAAIYRDGSRHGIGDYADMLLRTVTARAANAGALNMAARMGVQYMEVFDGFDCGWLRHEDPDKANGTIRSVQDCAQATISHPRCQRSVSPRPDITTPEQARSALPSTTEEQRADQAAAERARRGRGEAPRKPGPSGPRFPGGLNQKDAEAWMLKRWGVDADGKKRAIFLEGLGDKAANSVASTMDDLLRRFPETAKTIRVFGASPKVTKAVQQSTRYRLPKMSAAYADAARAVGAIRINAAKAKRFDETTAMLRRDVETGFHPPGTDTLEAVVRHEFGHHVKYVAEAKTSRAEVSAAILDETEKVTGLKATDPGFAKARWEAHRSVSRYAARNEDELFGEAFAEYLSSPAPRPFSKAIVERVVAMAET